MFIGNKYIEEVDQLSTELAKKLFDAEYAELHSPSASIACKTPIVALTKKGDLVLELEPKYGGFSSLLQLKSTQTLASNLRVAGLPFDFEEMNIDGEHAIKKIRSQSPRIVALGSTIFLFPHPVSEIAEAAKEIGSIVLYDASHVFGLVAGKRFQQPFKEGADIITGSTHKTLPGPQGGIILLKHEGDMAEKITTTLHDSLTGPGHPNIRAAQAVLYAEMIEFGRQYADQIIRTSKALAEALYKRGFDVICEKKGFTESHMIVVNVSKMGGSHKVGKILDKANIVVTKSGIPGVDKLESLYSGPISGIRLGTQEAVRIGLGPSEMDEVSDFFARVLIKGEDPSRVAKDISEFRLDYQKIYYCFDEGAEAYKYASAR
jgi:glycine hydroxymethyltransferase